MWILQQNVIFLPITINKYKQPSIFFQFDPDAMPPVWRSPMPPVWQWQPGWHRMRPAWLTPHGPAWLTPCASCLAHTSCVLPGSHLMRPAWLAPCASCLARTSCLLPGSHLMPPSWLAPHASCLTATAWLACASCLLSDSNCLARLHLMPPVCRSSSCLKWVWLHCAIQ